MNNQEHRSFGRAVNRVDIEQVVSSVPTASRTEAFSFLVDARERYPELFEDDQLPETPICDGLGTKPDGTDCEDLEGCSGANDFLVVTGQNPNLQTVLKAPFVGSDLSTIGKLSALFTNEVTHVSTVEARILDHVELFEHKLHRVGMRVNRRAGAALARMQFVKWLLLLELVYSVPLVAATGAIFPSFPYLLWFTAEDSSYWAIVRTYFQVPDFFSRTSWALAAAVTPSELVFSSLVHSDCASGWFSYSCIFRYLIAYLFGFDPAYATPEFKSFGQCFDVGGFYCIASKLSSSRPYTFENLLKWQERLFFTIHCFSMLCTLVACLCAVFLGFHFARLFGYSLMRLVSWWQRRSLTARLQRSVDESVEQPEPIADAIASMIDKAMLKKGGYNTLEMSQKGSGISPAAFVPGLVHMIKMHENEVSLIGMGFRYKDYVVTVEHNVTCLSSTPGNSYMVPYVKKGDYGYADTSRYVELTSDMIKQDIVPQHLKMALDLAVIPIGNKAWSTLKVATLKPSPITWNANVVVTGLVQEHKLTLQRSVGAILADKSTCFHKCKYNASTLPGWSGSPVLLKNKVVAIHCGNDGQVNYGLNFAFVERLVAIVESSRLEDSSSAYSSEWSKEDRDKFGQEAEFEDYGWGYDDDRDNHEDDSFDAPNVPGVDLGFAFRSKKSGRISFRERTDAFFDNSKGTQGRPWAEIGYDDEDLSGGKLSWANDGKFESGETRLTVDTKVNVEQTATVPSSPKKGLFFYADEVPLRKVTTTLRLSTPYFKGYPEDKDRYLDMERALALGYDDSKYIFPKATDSHASGKVSMLSLHNYLLMGLDVRRNGTPPSDQTRSRAISIIGTKLKPMRYATDCTGVTRQKILDQINSSVVNGSRSPGLPFTPKFQRNDQVIEHYGPEGLADLVVTAYENGTWMHHSVNFPKIEPTKHEKIDEGLDRNVQAVSLIVQLIFRCFLSDMLASASEHYRQTPLMFGWSPLRPGDAEFIYDKLKGSKRFKDHKIYTCDGKAFEFTAHTEEAYEDVSEIMADLMVPKAGVSEEKFLAYREEFLKFMNTVGLMGYHLPNGLTIEKLVAFLLNSGRYDTYPRNSITGLYWDVVAKLDIGYSVDEILREFIELFGGDDDVQAVPPTFEPDVYKKQMESYGLTIHKINLAPIEEGFEFFSWLIKKDSSGFVTFVPTRFTKHVENFRACQHESRPGALSSHMMNWIHDSERFEFFRDTYMKGHESDPATYPIDLVIDRRQFLKHLSGHENRTKVSKLFCLPAVPWEEC